MGVAIALSTLLLLASSNLIAGELESLVFQATDTTPISAMWNHATPSASRIIVVAPGFAQHQGTQLMKDLSQQLSKYGDVLVFDFRGTGKSAGTFWFGSKEYMDLDGILKWARANYHDVALLGFSLGAYTSLRAAYLWPDRIDQLLLVSCPTRVDDIVWDGGVVNNAVDTMIHWQLMARQEPGNWLFHWGPIFAAKPDDSQLALDVKLPVHFLVGGADHLIDEAMTRKIYNAYAGPKDLQVIPGGHHSEAMTEENKPQFVQWVSTSLGIQE